jgi:hypothetical protein
MKNQSRYSWLALLADLKDPLSGADPEGHVGAPQGARGVVNSRVHEDTAIGAYLAEEVPAFHVLDPAIGVYHGGQWRPQGQDRKSGPGWTMATGEGWLGRSS